MKKLLVLSLALFLVLSGCSKGSEGAGSKEIDELVIFFVPSRDAEQIETRIEPIKQLVIDGLKLEGYTVGSVDIRVSNSYEGAGEALANGSAHIGFIPGGTYALYSENQEIDVILASTRDGLNKDSVDAKDWNDGLPTLPTDEQVTFYRSLIYGGTTAKAKELTEKVNSGVELTWEDFDSANWCHMNSSSSAGYIYPSLWLAERYEGKTVADLSNKVLATSYTDVAARLSNGQCDVGVGYADIRRDYAEQWVNDWGKTDIFTETSILGVTEGIMNDTISVSNELVDADLKKALQTVFIELAKTEAGKEAIAIYSHDGYMIATDADYEPARKSLELVK